LVTLNRSDAARLQGSFNVLNHRKPRKKRETLENDRNVGKFSVDRVAVPVDCSATGRGEAGEHPHQGGLPTTGRSKKRKNLSGKHCKVDWGNYLNVDAHRPLPCQWRNNLLARPPGRRKIS